MKSATELQPFRFQLKDLLSLHYLVKTVEDVIGKTKGDSFEVAKDNQAKDNFGSYAVGFRCFLRDKKSGKTLYIYFGTIYSYKKQAGIFAEVDRGSNQGFFAEVWNNIRESEQYELNKQEEPFVKLFLPSTEHERLMKEKSEKGQAEILRKFFTATCEAFVQSLA